MALIVSYIAKWFIHIKEKSFFILELPTYRAPRWKNVIPTMISKAKIFVVDAGKIIMIISLVLWALSSFGPGNTMQEITAKYEQLKWHSPVPTVLPSLDKAIIPKNWKVLLPALSENPLSLLLLHWAMTGKSGSPLLLLLPPAKFLWVPWPLYIVWGIPMMMVYYSRKK
jgi:hypothetical protein